MCKKPQRAAATRRPSQTGHGDAECGIVPGYLGKAEAELPKSHRCTHAETRGKRNLTYLLVPAKQHAHGLTTALAAADARGYRRHLGEAGWLRGEVRLGAGRGALGHALVAVTRCQ